MSSFAIPLSGLDAAQAQLKAVSNNLANMNTIGYKDQTVNFSDLFSNAYALTTNGSGDPVETGNGVQTASTDINFTQGDTDSTGTSSNMMLNGNGFFVTQDSSGNMSYTRAGDFTTNTAGQLQTPGGNTVLGYPAMNGVVDTTANLQAINVGALTSPAVATQNFHITANLNSQASVGDAGAPSSFQVYDSLGQAHTVTVSYAKTATNQWSYSISIPSSDLSSGGTGSTVIGTGTLNFDSSGNLDVSGGKTVAVNLNSTSSFSDGASNLNMTWDLTDSSGNNTLSQTASASTTSATNQDGYPSGTLTSYSVQPDGTIEGSFSSGKSIALGQVAVAVFANTQGLANTSGTNFEPTPASGAAVVGMAGTGGRGTITGSAVEQSNVDISTEFAKLIVAQQAYSANAKSITAFNQVSQATIAMIQ